MISKLFASKIYLVLVFMLAIMAMLFPFTEAYSEGGIEQWIAFFTARSGHFIYVLVGLMILLAPYLWARLEGQWLDMARVYVLSFAIIASISNYWLATLSIWIIGAWAIFEFIYRRRVYLKMAYVILFSLFAVKMIFYFFSETSFKLIEQCISFAVLPIVFSLIPINKAVRRQVYVLSVGAILAIAILHLFRIYEYQQVAQLDIWTILSAPKAYYPNHLFFPVYDHPTYYTVPILMIFPMMFYLIKTSPSKRLLKWALSWLLLIPVCVSVLFTGSRFGLVVVIACVSIYIAFSSNHKPWIQTLICVVCAIGALLVLKHYEFVDQTNFTDPYREAMIEESKSRIQAHPWLGSGLQEQFYPVHNASDKAFNTPHNQFLNDLVLLGVLGSLPLWLLCLFIIFRTLRPRFNYNLLFWLAIFMPLMWIETPFESAAMVIPFVFWTCLFFADDQITDKRKILALNDGVD